MTHSKFIISAVIAIGLISAVFVQRSATEWVQACACDANSAEFDASLPVSHPANRCSLQHSASNQSWWAWLAGDSRSAEYHFIDLLELISSSKSDKSISPKDRQS